MVDTSVASPRTVSPWRQELALASQCKLHYHHRHHHYHEKWKSYWVQSKAFSWTAFHNEDAELISLRLWLSRVVNWQKTFKKYLQCWHVVSKIIINQETPFLNPGPARSEPRTPPLLVHQSVVMLLMEQCRNVVLFVLSWTEKSELCYRRRHGDNERRREQLLGLFLFLFQSKQALTLLFFLLIKLLERGAGLTGPCLAGRPRVNGPKLNRRHLWAALSHCFPPPRIFSGRPPLSRWPVQWEECHSENPESATKSCPAEWGFHGTGPNPDAAKIPQMVLTSSDRQTLWVTLCLSHKGGVGVACLHTVNARGHDKWIIWLLQQLIQSPVCKCIPG